MSTLKPRINTSTDWTSFNFVLLENETGIESDTGKIKIGNGVDAWNDLEYIGSEPNPKTILHDSNFPIHTGVTGATIVKSVNIPANTIPENCFFRILVKMKWTKSTNYKFFYLTANTNNANFNKIVNYIGTSTNNASVDLQTVIRNCYIKDGIMHVTNTAHYRSDYVVSDDEEIPFNVTIDNELNFWCSVSDVNDEMEILGTTVEVIF